MTGCGESGKSTILKQMRLVHGEGFPESERMSVRNIIFSNVLQSMKLILLGMKKLEISLDSNQQVYANEIENTPDFLTVEGCLMPSTISAISILWASSNVQLAYSKATKYYLIDSAK